MSHRAGVEGSTHHSPLALDGNGDLHQALHCGGGQGEAALCEAGRCCCPASKYMPKLLQCGPAAGGGNSAASAGASRPCPKFHFRRRTHRHFSDTSHGVCGVCHHDILENNAICRLLAKMYYRRYYLLGRGSKNTTCIPSCLKRHSKHKNLPQQGRREYLFFPVGLYLHSC